MKYFGVIKFLRIYYHAIMSEIHLYLMNKFVQIEYLNDYHELKYDLHVDKARWIVENEN